MNFIKKQAKKFDLQQWVNPQPCGFFNDPTRECSCTPAIIQRYVSKISGPLLDRIDIHIDVPAVKYAELSTKTPGESSELIRQRICRARHIQQERFNKEKVYANAQMTPRLIRTHCEIDIESQRHLEQAMTKMGLSARAYDRILKVARTIADMEEQKNIADRHISEAIQYRSLDRTYWA